MKTLVVLLFLFAATIAGAQTKIQGLLTESERSPIGIDITKPHFSWQMSSARRAYLQTAYRIEVSNPARRTVWDSGKVESGNSVNIPFSEDELKPTTRYSWKVTVWEDGGREFTGSSRFETGLMNADPNMSAWDGSTWIGGTDDDLVLYAQYSSIFKLDYTQKVDQGSTRAGFIVGATSRSTRTH
jgi:alpha-L-rhamnosidase